MGAATFRDVRTEREARTRPVTDKRMTAVEAAALVRDGDHVAIGGTCYSRTPMALLFALLKLRRQRLTISRPLLSYEAELFLATGAAERIVTSWVGIGLRWGLAPVFRHYIETGAAAYEEWSHMAMGLRYRAGAMGVPFLPTFSMLGSDLAPAVRVVVSAERIVSTDEISTQPWATMLPHFAVDAVVEAPHGAYPHECYGVYEADLEHFDGYAALVRDGGADAARRYVAEHVDAHPDFASFLAAAGTERLAARAAGAERLMPR